MLQFQLYHGENKLHFNEIMMTSILYYAYTISEIIIVLDHWNNRPLVDRSFHVGRSTRTHYPDLEVWSYHLCCRLIREATHTNIIVFGLKWMGVKPTVYHTQDEHANHYTTEAVHIIGYSIMKCYCICLN